MKNRLFTITLMILIAFGLSACDSSGTTLSVEDEGAVAEASGGDIPLGGNLEPAGGNDDDENVEPTPRQRPGIDLTKKTPTESTVTSLKFDHSKEKQDAATDAVNLADMAKKAVDDTAIIALDVDRIAIETDSMVNVNDSGPLKAKVDETWAHSNNATEYFLKAIEARDKSKLLADEATALLANEESTFADIKNKKQEVKVQHDIVMEMSKKIGVEKDKAAAIKAYVEKNTVAVDSNTDISKLFLNKLSFLGVAGGGQGDTRFAHICNGNIDGKYAISEFHVKSGSVVNDISIACSSINDYGDKFGPYPFRDTGGDVQPAAMKDGYFFTGWTVSVCDHDGSDVITGFIPHAKRLEGGSLVDEITFGGDDKDNARIYGAKNCEPQVYDCGDNEALVGIQGRSGSLIDSLQGICQKVSGSKAGPGLKSSWRLGTRIKYLVSGGEDETDVYERSMREKISCNKNWNDANVIVGFRGQSGSVVDGLYASCGSLEDGYTDKSKIEILDDELNKTFGGGDSHMMKMDGYVMVGWRMKMCGDYDGTSVICEFQPIAKKMTSNGLDEDSIVYGPKIGKGKIWYHLNDDNKYDASDWQEEICDAGGALTDIDITWISAYGEDAGLVSSISGICKNFMPPEPESAE